MRPKKFLLILLFACAFLYLLCRPQAASASVRSGLLLWYHSVVPTLLPFMLLTGFLLRLRLLEPLLPFLQRCLAPIFGCSGYGAFAILCGFTAGFPMGSKLTRTLLDQKKISHEEACHLIGFVNNPSPAFLLSYVATPGAWHPAHRKRVRLCVALRNSILFSLSFRSHRYALPIRPCPCRNHPRVATGLLCPHRQLYRRCRIRHHTDWCLPHCLFHTGGCRSFCSPHIHSRRPGPVRGSGTYKRHSPDCAFCSFFSGPARSHPSARSLWRMLRHRPVRRNRLHGP